jgi:hypothetical protein
VSPTWRIARTGVLALSSDRDECALHAGQPLSQRGVHPSHYIWGCFASNLLSIIERQSLGRPVRNAVNFPKAISAPSKEERYLKLDVSRRLEASSSCQHGRCVYFSLLRCLFETEVWELQQQTGNVSACQLPACNKPTLPTDTPCRLNLHITEVALRCEKDTRRYKAKLPSPRGRRDPWPATAWTQNSCVDVTCR